MLASLLEPTHIAQLISLPRLLNKMRNRLGRGVHISTPKAPAQPVAHTQTDQVVLTTKPPPATFERIEEYKVLAENLAQLGARRLTTNTVFVGFNTLFMVAIASLLSSTHFDSWWLVAKVAAISIAITPVNVIWIHMLMTYRIALKDRYDYIKTIEQEFQRRRQEPNDKIGLWSKLYPSPIKHRHTLHEIALARYFTIFYPLILLVVAVMIYLVTNGYIPRAP